MAAADEEDVAALNEHIEKLSVSSAQVNDEASKSEPRHDDDKDDAKTLDCPEPQLWGFETRELYKLALNFYKGKVA